MTKKKKYRVFLKMSELLEATVEAESEEEADNIFRKKWGNEIADKFY